jgi:hypothetical protein
LFKATDNSNNNKIFRSIILPVVLYGYETWSVILRDKHRLRVFENGVFRKIFGLKKDEVTSVCVEDRVAEELYALNSSPNIIRLRNKEEREDRGSRQVWGGKEICI